MNAPSYDHRPIGSVDALARALGTRPQSLLDLAQRASELYPLASDAVQAVAGGPGKVVYSPARPLKVTQQRIVRAIFGAVTFPEYLNGGIRRRSYRDDSALHTESQTVVKLDGKTFFESVDAHLVREIWQYFFRFPPGVAKLLTTLTTHDGRLPRGAPTSVHLANLLFWDSEADLVENLALDGLKYSRYVDDVTISAKQRLKMNEISSAVGKVYGMFIGKGVMPNRDKEAVAFGDGPLRVHGVNVNGVQPTIPKKVRKCIRAEAHALSREISESGMDEVRTQRLRRLQGKLAWMAMFHPRTSQRLRQQLAEALITVGAPTEIADSERGV